MFFSYCAVSTPEAIHGISLSVQRESQSQKSKRSLPHSPISSKIPSSSHIPSSRRRNKHDKQGAGTRVTSMTGFDRISDSKVTHQSSTGRSHVTQSADRGSLKTLQTKDKLTTPGTTQRQRTPRSKPTTDSTHTQPCLLDFMPKAHDILAEQVHVCLYGLSLSLSLSLSLPLPSPLFLFIFCIYMVGTSSIPFYR